MSQDQTTTLHGPYTATFDDGNGGAVYTITACNKDSIEVNLTTKIATMELVDGSEISDAAGRMLEVNLKIDELVPADLDALKALFDQTAATTHSLAVQFTNMPAASDLITFVPDAAPATSRQLFVETDIENGKPVIKVKQAAPVGATVANQIPIT